MLNKCMFFHDRLCTDLLRRRFMASKDRRIFHKFVILCDNSSDSYISIWNLQKMWKDLAIQIQGHLQNEGALNI